MLWHISIPGGESKDRRSLLPTLLSARGRDKASQICRAVAPGAYVPYHAALSAIEPHRPWKARGLWINMPLIRA